MSETSLNLEGVPLGAPVTGDARIAADARLRQLVDTHYDFVWRTLRRLGVQEGDVDDGVQKVFLVATAKLAAIRAGSEQSFLFQSAIRVAADFRRALRRRREVSDADTKEQADHSPRADELIDMRDARRTLDTILDGMSLELRAVFTLFELEQMTLSEIAALLTVPRGTVASRLRRAKAFFHEGVVREAARAKGATER